MKIKSSKIPGWCVSSKFVKLHLFNFAPFFWIVKKTTLNFFRKLFKLFVFEYHFFHHSIIGKKNLILYKSSVAIVQYHSSVKIDQTFRRLLIWHTSIVFQIERSSSMVVLVLEYCYFFAFCRLLRFHTYLDYLACSKPISVEVNGYQL